MIKQTFKIKMDDGTEQEKKGYVHDIWGIHKEEIFNSATKKKEVRYFITHLLSGMRFAGFYNSSPAKDFVKRISLCPFPINWEQKGVSNFKDNLPKLKEIYNACLVDFRTSHGFHSLTDCPIFKEEI